MRGRRLLVFRQYSGAQQKTNGQRDKSLDGWPMPDYCHGMHSQTTPTDRARHFAGIRSHARQMLLARTCDNCGGEGTVDSHLGAHECPSCDGTGSMVVQRLNRLHKARDARESAAREALAHLGAVLAQVVPSDDPILIEHCREAHRLLKQVVA